jgi:L-lactate dehydrogenase
MVEQQSSQKVGIVGTGMVGSSFAYALMQRGIASEMVLINNIAERAVGEMMDLNHGLSFAKPMKIIAGDYKDLAGAKVVVVTAGAAQLPEVFLSIIPKIVEHNPDGIILIATNPVDILTYISLKESKLPPSKVVGSGTILDTSRFRFLLGQHYGVDTRSVHAYIVGEHGDSEIPLWSLANIGGVRLQEFAPLQREKYDQEAMTQIFTSVRDAAYEIIKRKRATYYAIGLGLLSIVEAILGDYRSVLSVSSLLTGQYGVSDVCLSLPCVVGVNGIEEILPVPMNTEEQAGFCASAEKLKTTLDALHR